MKKLLFIIIPYFALSQTNFKPKSDGQKIDHSYYSISYNETHEQDEWVYSKSNDKMIGIVMPNQKITNDLIYYVKSVDYIGSITGIDFFYQLEDVYEEKLESEIDLNDWNSNK